MAVARVSARYRTSYVESYESNFITAVGGTSTSVDISLPAGWYDTLQVYGTHAAAATDPTLQVKMYTASGTGLVSLYGEDTDSSPAVTTISLELANTAVSLWFSKRTNTVQTYAEPIYLPYGLQAVYTKNGGTAVNLTLVARRVG